ncbi:MAG: hypothetical protein OXC91_13345, partial [Rhodobacteraceae bacterium]|nr:hypothetical protein [Paracoccaceae bacterium]
VIDILIRCQLDGWRNFQFSPARRPDNRQSFADLDRSEVLQPLFWTQLNSGTMILSFQTSRRRSRARKMTDKS